ncbi:MAG: hypothetical protein RR646_04190 [Erysipelotrichaceae bacterium]
MYAASTGIFLGQKLLAWKYTSTPAFDLVSEYDTAMGADAGVYFSGLGKLENSYSDFNERKLTIWLKDQDGFGNEDDTIRTYVGTFKGRELTSIVVEKSNDNGPIDAQGDSKAELYLTSYLGSDGKDDEIPGGTELYFYQLVLK